MGMFPRIATIALTFAAVNLVQIPAYAGVSISPFVSISSTKKISPGASGTEKTSLKQRTTYGVTGSLSFFRILSLQASVGTNDLVTTEKTSQAADEFNEIDFEKDLNMSTEDPEQEVKTTEKMYKGRVGLSIDPGFWIFVLRAKAGVQATKRDISLEQGNRPKETYESPITYDPYAGGGFGVRLSPRISAIAEYNFFFYKFPETEPFEREVAVTVNVSI